MAWRTQPSATARATTVPEPAEPQRDKRVSNERAAADAELYARVVGRRHDAFAELYELYFHELYDFAARITHDRTAAADIVQSVFATVWERTGRGEQVRSPRAWLYRLTHNAAIDEVRRRKWTSAGEADDSFDFAALEDIHADEPTRVLIDKEVAELVWSTAEKMRPEEYGLLDLYVRRELGPDELAEELGITPGALYTRLSRLRRSFEEALTVTLLARRGGRDCEVFGALVAELGADADGEEGSRVLRDHVDACPDCRRARSRYVSASAILAGLAPVPLVAGVQGAVWSSLSQLLGLGVSAGAAGAAATAHGGAGASSGTAQGPVSSVMGAVSANPVAAVAAVAAAVAVGVGSWAAVSALRPAGSDGVARDPVRFWSPEPGTVRAAGDNRITISWTRLPDAAGYSILWSHGARDVPDAVADLPGTATRTVSPALAPGTWYFHLRTQGRDDWTHTVHLGPFVIREAPTTEPGDSGARPAPARSREAAPISGGPATAPERSVAAPADESPAPESPASPQREAPPLDLTPPSGQTVTVAGGPYYRSLSVLLVLRPGTDRDSGVDPSSGVVERSVALLARGSCGAWSSWSPVVLRASADTAVADGHCYRYRYRIADRAGNESAFSSPSAAAIVDTTPPAPPTLTVTSSGPETAVAGGSVFYRPSGGGGTFTVAASSDDRGSGLAAIEFPGLTGGIAPPAATRRTAEPYEVVYTWSTGASESGVVRVTAFDRAGNSADAELTLAPDAVGPAGHSVALAAGAWLSEASVPLVIAEGSDAGSGMAAGSLVVERESAPLSSGSCGDFGGTWTTVAVGDGSDTTVADGACYRYRVSASDRVGNIATSAPSEAARVDTTPPSVPVLTLLESSTAVHVSGATVFYRPTADGSLTVVAAGDDPQSGLARVSFPTMPGTAGGGDDPDAPYEARYDWSALGAAGIQTVTATNAAGLSATSPFTLARDATGPTGVSVTAAASASSIALTINQGSDSGSGVDAGSLVVERDAAPVSGASCGPFAGTWTTVTLTGDEDTTVAGGVCYRYRVGVGDNVGNRTTSAPSATVIVDGTPPSAPTLTLGASSAATYVSGGTVFYRLAAGSFTVAATSSDPDSGIAEIVFPTLPGSSGGGSDRSAPFQTIYSWTALAAPWSATAEVTATNAVGLAASSTFTLTRDDTGPEVEVTARREGESGHIRVEVLASDAGSGLSVAAPFIERDSAPMEEKTCGSFSGTWTQIILDSKKMDQTALSHTCYRYRARVVDNVGNATQSAPVDAT